ncbi:hypothetical protein [Shimazuella kribbensis]|uniref:hypothetical protein n=1 Tax=Shimazuella kribbensis TaxID=139808 RepID=UPI0004036419|nr:hypothetical protein [Shimazuella kribbensis]
MKWMKQGILILILFAIFSSVTGCDRPDDAQKTAATFYSNLYAKSDKPSRLDRYHKLEEIISKTTPLTTYMDGMAFMVLIDKSIKNGLSKPYYLADDPTKPQTETKRHIVFRFKKSDAPALFDQSTPDEYHSDTITLIKESDKWKVIGFAKTDKKITTDPKIEWTEINPTDYLKE